MSNDTQFLQALKRTRILRPPKHAMATFGTTTLHYVLLSALPDQPGYCRLREGDVTAQRPKILTPEVWANRFEGFGDDAAAYREEVERHYGDALKALEYTFKNDLKSTSTEHASLIELVDRTSKRMDAESAPRVALLEGPDSAWSVSVMKFIIDMSLRSFPTNVRELDERGLFNPGRQQDMKTRYDIERLFQESQKDRSRLAALAERLKQSGLFAEYEDRFFSLVRS